MISLASAKDMRRAIVPYEDVREATLLPGIDSYAIRTLADLVNHLNGENPIAPLTDDASPLENVVLFKTDFSEIRGQEHVKRGFEVAAPADYNLLVYGTEHPHTVHLGW
jgi:magnesium chelatase family protein